MDFQKCAKDGCGNFTDVPNVLLCSEHQNGGCLSAALGLLIAVSCAVAFAYIATVSIPQMRGDMLCWVVDARMLWEFQEEPVWACVQVVRQP